MINGDEFKGFILKQDDKIIVLKTVNGEINLLAPYVKSIENDDYIGEYSFENPTILGISLEHQEYLLKKERATIKIFMLHSTL